MQSFRRWKDANSEGPDGKPLANPPTYHTGLPPVSPGSLDLAKQPNLPWKESDPPDLRFKELIRAASDASGRGSKPADLDHFDEYLKLIWNLSLSVPLEYIERHPFDFSTADELIIYGVPASTGQANLIELTNDETLRKNLDLIAGEPDPAGGFNIQIDGVQLKRPINLPVEQLNKKARIHSPVIMVAKEYAPFSDKDLDSAGGSLSFEAYLYWNGKIVPRVQTHSNPVAD